MTNKRHLTLHRLQKLSGIPLQSLDHYELGKGEISVDNLLKIACVFETDIIALIK